MEDKQLTYFQARVLADIEQEDMAKKLGVTHQTMCNYETYKTFPPADIFDKFCKICKISRDKILINKKNKK